MEFRFEPTKYTMNSNRPISFSNRHLFGFRIAQKKEGRWKLSICPNHDLFLSQIGDRMITKSYSSPTSTPAGLTKVTLPPLTRKVPTVTLAAPFGSLGVKVVHTGTWEKSFVLYRIVEFSTNK